MKTFLEYLAYLSPSILILLFIYLAVKFYFLIRNYLLLKTKYYTLKIKELENKNE